jgi:hypothetical protein
VIPFLAHFLFVLAGWTLVIKFAFPVAFALAEGAPVTSYIMWDFWWVAHLWLGWALLAWRRYSYALALGVAVAEIAIVTVKFALFLSQPVWTIWTTNWFVNKLFVLACFLMMLGYFTLARGRVRAYAARALTAAGA